MRPTVTESFSSEATGYKRGTLLQKLVLYRTCLPLILGNFSVQVFCTTPLNDLQHLSKFLWRKEMFSLNSHLKIWIFNFFVSLLVFLLH